MPDPIGNINNLISQKTSPPRSPKNPSRIEVLEGRVATLESALQTVVKELTSLRAEVQRKPESPKETAPPKTEVSKPSAAAAPSPTTPKAKRKSVQPWDNPETLKALEACRPKILELLSDGTEITKAGCADVLGIDASLAGRTLSYMMTVKKEIEMISPPATEADPDPKKIFRRKPK